MDTDDTVNYKQTNQTAEHKVNKSKFFFPGESFFFTHSPTNHTLHNSGGSISAKHVYSHNIHTSDKSEYFNIRSIYKFYSVGVINFATFYILGTEKKGYLLS